MSFLKKLWGKEDYEETFLGTLMEKGLITLDRAQELLVEVRDTGRRAAELVVENGVAHEGVLMAFLARSLRTAPLDVTKFPMRKDIALLVTAETAVTGRLLPMEKIGSSLTVAMSNPLDRRAIAKVEKETGLKVKIVVTGPRMLLSRLKEAYPQAEELLGLAKPAQKAPGPPSAASVEKHRAPVRVVIPHVEEVGREAPKEEPAPVSPEPPKTQAERPVPQAETKTPAPADAQPAAQEPAATAEPIPVAELPLSLEEHAGKILADISEPYAEPISAQAAPVISPSSTKRKRKK